MRAYQVQEDETSTSSGLPVWLTRTVDPTITFIIEERKDYADAELLEWDHKNGQDAKKRGVARFAVPVDAQREPIEYGGAKRRELLTAASQEQQDLVRDDELAEELGVEIDRGRPAAGWNAGDFGNGVTAPA